MGEWLLKLEKHIWENGKIHGFVISYGNQMMRNILVNIKKKRIGSKFINSLTKENILVIFII